MKISKTSFMTLLLAVIMFLPLNIAMAKILWVNIGRFWQPLRQELLLMMKIA